MKVDLRETSQPTIEVQNPKYLLVGNERIQVLSTPIYDNVSIHKVASSLINQDYMSAEIIIPEKDLKRENGTTKSPSFKLGATAAPEILPLGEQVKDWNIINMLKSKRIHRLQKTVALQKKQIEYLKSYMKEIKTVEEVSEEMSMQKTHLLDHSYTMDKPIEQIIDIKKDSGTSKFNYPSSIIPKMCRVCMKQYEVLFQEATVVVGGLEISIQEIYHSLTRVQLTDNLELPNSLCKYCIEGMLQAYIFFKKALDANKALSDKLTKARMNCMQNSQNFVSGSVKPKETNNHNRGSNQTESILKKLLVENKKIYKKECVLNNAVGKCKEVIDLDQSGNKKVNQDKNSCEPEFSEALNDATNKSPVDVHDVIHWECDSDYIANGLSSAQLIKEIINKNSKTKRSEDDIIVQCKICNARLLMSMIENHKKKCSRERAEGHVCSLCDNIFLTKDELAQHRRSNHSRILCSICGTLVRKAHWNYHQNRHSGAKPFKCIICDKSFNSTHNLRKHIDVHNNQRKYKCKVCSKGFNRSSQLFVHMRIHTGQRPYICVICNKQFTTNGNLKNHQRVHQIVINQEECAV